MASSPEKRDSDKKNLDPIKNTEKPVIKKQISEKTLFETSTLLQHPVFDFLRENKINTLNETVFMNAKYIFLYLQKTLFLSEEKREEEKERIIEAFAVSYMVRITEITPSIINERLKQDIIKQKKEELKNAIQEFEEKEKDKQEKPSFSFKISSAVSFQEEKKPSSFRETLPHSPFSKPTLEQKQEKKEQSCLYFSPYKGLKEVPKNNFADIFPEVRKYYKSFLLKKVGEALQNIPSSLITAEQEASFFAEEKEKLIQTLSEKYADSIIQNTPTPNTSSEVRRKIIENVRPLIEKELSLPVTHFSPQFGLENFNTETNFHILFEEISENLDLYIETEKEGIRKNLHFCLPKREEEIIAKNIKDEIRTQIEAVYIQKTLRSIPLADISEIKYMAEEQCRRKIQEVLEMA